MANNMRVMNYNTPKEIESDMRSIVRQCTGRTYVFSCRKSHLRDDTDTYLVIGRSTLGYSVWHYNARRKDLFWGHYDLPFPAVMDYLAAKLNGRE